MRRFAFGNVWEGKCKIGLSISKNGNEKFNSHFSGRKPGAALSGILRGGVVDTSRHGIGYLERKLCSLMAPLLEVSGHKILKTGEVEVEKSFQTFGNGGTRFVLLEWSEIETYCLFNFANASRFPHFIK